MNKEVSLLQMVENRIASGSVTLPPCHEVAGRLQEITSDPDFKLDDVVDLIVRDAALTTGVLRAANSAYFGGLSAITTIRDAAVRLGAPEVLRLALLASEKERYRVRSPQLESYMEPMWRHSLLVATGSRWLAAKLGYSDMQNQAFIGGLLHDVGGLLLIKALDDLLAAGEAPAEPAPELVTEIINSAHARLGYELVAGWDIPEIYCEVVRDHHETDKSAGSTLLNVVALADKACWLLEVGLESDPSIVLTSTEEAFTLGADDLLLAQLQVMLEDHLALA
ncbi:HDOD domain-containing protein [bacterium]|nr:HDOD domain-containing protein [bacterium]